MTATSPIHPPRLETTWAIHSRKKAAEWNTPHDEAVGAPGTSGESPIGTNGAGPGSGWDPEPPGPAVSPGGLVLATWPPA
jgi:hypothetical protein